MKSQYYHCLRILFFTGAFFQWSALVSAQVCTCNPLYDCENFTVFVRHHIDDHPVFDKSTTMDTFCANSEFPAYVNVVADGTESTTIEIVNVSCGCGALLDNHPVMLNQLDDNFEIIGNSQPARYGVFHKEDFQNHSTTFTFQHPTDLPGPGEVKRQIFVRVDQETANGILLHAFIIVEVYRYPVVMIHGLWSDRSAFDAMEGKLLQDGHYMDYQLYKVDYSSSNGAPFDYNFDVAPNGIDQVIRNCEDHGLSVGKVDLVVHSMGGLLSRKYLQGSLYPSRKDVHRLITCNTPHAGSQMANFLLDNTQYGNVFSEAFGRMGMNCYGGAVDNLRVNSVQIAAIQAGQLPEDVEVHSVITVSDAIGSYANLFSLVMSKAGIFFITTALIGSCTNLFIDDVFDNDDNDGVVAAESQAGSLTSYQTTLINDQVHTGSVGNLEVIMDVEGLLDEPMTSAMYAIFYSPVSLSYSLDFPCLPFAGDVEEAKRSIAFALNIDSPVTGTTVLAGDTITVTYSAEMVDTVVLAIRFKADSLALIANAASADSMEFIIPANMLGQYTLLAMGFAADHKIKVMDSIQLNINCSATLDSLIFYPPAMYLNQNDSLSFTISGIYNDGIKRDLTRHPSVMFDFSFDHASKTSENFIRLDSLVGDTLRISVDSIVSLPILINKAGYNFLPGCETVTNTNDDGFGSLRYALDCVSAYDTIQFDSSLAGDTIMIDSTILDIYKSVYIINANTEKISIKSNTAQRLIRIHRGINVWIEHIDFVSSDPATSAVVNNGNLTFKNVELSNTYGGISHYENNESSQLTVIGDCELK